MKINQEAYKEFEEFISERFKIWWKKEIKKSSFPWTEDKILQKYKFTNVWRQDDRTTRAIQKRLSVFKGASFEKDEDSFKLMCGLILNIFLLRLVNNPKEIERVSLVEFGNVRNWKEKKLHYSDAFIILPALDKGTKKIDEIKRLLLEIELRLDLGITDVSRVYSLVRIKGLILYELMLDYWQFMELPEEYCNVGQGAVPMLKMIFPEIKKSEYGEAVKWIVEDLRVKFVHPVWGIFTMRCAEGMLCEARKAYNLKHDPKARKRMYRYEDKTKIHPLLQRKETFR